MPWRNILRLQELDPWLAWDQVAQESHRVTKEITGMLALSIVLMFEV